MSSRPARSSLSASSGSPSGSTTCPTNSTPPPPSLPRPPCGDRRPVGGYIDHGQLRVAEKVGVEARGSYYEEAGALRDRVQTHMFQLLALTAMEPPISFAPDVVRDERVKI